MQRDPGAVSLILLAAALLAGVLVLSDHALSTHIGAHWALSLRNYSPYRAETG
jgi:hypothetical protein